MGPGFFREARETAGQAAQFFIGEGGFEASDGVDLALAQPRVVERMSRRELGEALAQGIGLLSKAQEVFGPGKHGKLEQARAGIGIAQVAGLDLGAIGLEAEWKRNGSGWPQESVILFLEAV